MAQNIYDEAPFFDKYAKLERSVGGLNAAPEWPVLRNMLGDMTGRWVLDLGCGYGWFCRWAVEAGAQTAHGVDVSEKMIEKAKAMTSAKSTAITYEQADIDQMTLRPGDYDTVYSSLTFHYLGDLDRLFDQIHKTMPPGGTFVFSVEHPIFTAPSDQTWRVDPDGKPIWPLTSYYLEGKRSYAWLGRENVEKSHRTIETYLRTLWRTGFSVVDLVEWMPTEEDLRKHPDWANARERPMFLLISAKSQ